MLWCSLLLAQPFPPDSVWTFAFDDGGDEYFYDAVEVEDGYLLCGEALEWNALAGEALLVKINQAGELVWTRRFGGAVPRKFLEFADWHGSIQIFGETLSASGNGNGLLHYDIDEDGDSIAAYDIGYPDGRYHAWGGVGFFENELDTTRVYYYTARIGENEDYLIREVDTYPPSVVTSVLGMQCTGVFQRHSHIGSTPIVTGKRYAGAELGWNGLGVRWIELGELGPHFEILGVGDDALLSGTNRPDEDPVYVGYLRSLNHTRDLFVGSTHNDLLVWSRTYGGLSCEDGVEIVNASDSGYVIAGNFSSEDIEFEQSDFWLLKVDEDGDSVWSVLAGRDEADRCEGMIQTQNGFLLFGASQSYAVPGWDGCAMYLGYVPDLAVSPASLNFGPVQVGDSAVRTVNLVNTGSNVLTVNGFSATNAYHARFDEAATVEIGDTLRVDVVFAPQSGGSIVDTLRIQSDAITGEKILRCLGAGTGVSADDAPVPLEFALRPPYPNPFNAVTTLRYDLARESEVRLELFDVNGRLTRVLAMGTQSAGTHTATLDLHDASSGIYFAALRAGSDHAVQKLLLVK